MFKNFCIFPFVLFFQLQNQKKKNFPKKKNFSQGSQTTDLTRLSLDKATVIVIPDPTRSPSDADVFRDASTVMAARAIESQFKPEFVLSEIAQESNIKYLVARQHVKASSFEADPLRKRR